MVGVIFGDFGLFLSSSIHIFSRQSVTISIKSLKLQNSDKMLNPLKTGDLEPTM